MIIENFSNILFSMGAGTVIGFLIGFAIKRVIKIIAIIVGIFFAVVIYFQSQNIFIINWDKLQSISNTALVSIGNFFTDTGQISAIVGSLGIPLSGGMSAGFVIGFIKG